KPRRARLVARDGPGRSTDRGCLLPGGPCLATGVSPLPTRGDRRRPPTRTDRLRCERATVAASAPAPTQTDRLRPRIAEQTVSVRPPSGTTRQDRPLQTER